MNTKNILILIVGFLVIIAGCFWYLLSFVKKRTNTNNPTTGNIQNDYITRQDIITQDNISIIAGEALLNNSIVAIIDNTAYLFDSTNEAHFNVQCGFVISGVAINETATVYLSGTITLIGNILDANNKYFVGNNGNLIDEIPNNYGIQSVGYAISTNQIILDFSERYSL